VVKAKDILLDERGTVKQLTSALPRLLRLDSKLDDSGTRLLQV